MNYPLDFDGASATGLVDLLQGVGRQFHWHGVRVQASGGDPGSSTASGSDPDTTHTGHDPGIMPVVIAVLAVAVVVLLIRHLRGKKAAPSVQR